MVFIPFKVSSPPLFRARHRSLGHPFLLWRWLCHAREAACGSLSTQKLSACSQEVWEDRRTLSIHFAFYMARSIQSR